MKRCLFLILALSIYSAPAVFSQSMTVMSFNIHHGADKDEKDRIKEMAAFIKQSGVDIVGLQEVDSVCLRSHHVDRMKVLSQLTGMYYAFVRHFAYQDGAYGMGILSRYPISDVENIRLTLLKSKNPSTAMISATITVPGNKKIKFASAHFALDDSSRWVQANEVINSLSEEKAAVIFTGDLNATPDAKEMRHLEKYFKGTDAGNTPTYPAPVAVKKIDYIFVKRDDLKSIKKHQVPANSLSDHFRVVATVILK